MVGRDSDERHEFVLTSEKLHQEEFCSMSQFVVRLLHAKHIGAFQESHTVKTRMSVYVKELG